MQKLDFKCMCLLPFAAYVQVYDELPIINTLNQEKWELSM